MGLPVALEQLFDWLESCGLRFGDCLALSSQEIFLPRDCKGEKFDKIRGVTNEVRTGGTQLTFIKDPEICSCAFIGTTKYRTEVDERLYLLCQTGCDGSYAALWIDDEGKQQIVHIGAGSGSLLCCILAANPVDFIRLIAIGYEEICWSTDFPYPPNENPNSNDYTAIIPNLEFQKLVTETWDTSIPRTASEIVGHPSHCDDKDSADPFWRWMRRVCE